MFEIIKQDKETRARVGLLQINGRIVETPSYVVVGTKSEVKALGPDDIAATKTQMVIANTYHLWRKLKDGLNHFEGVHARIGWNGFMMTDSGGYQVFSLGARREYKDGKVIVNEHEVIERVGDLGFTRVTEEGVCFFDDGEECYLDAETSIAIQELLGADAIFVLDECTARHHGWDYTKASMRRTHRWAKRCLRAKTRSDQMLYGIVQGGPFEDLRQESTKFIGSLPFDGVAIGGHLGTKQKMQEVVDWCIPHLPREKPRHLLGIGAVDDLFNFVERGIDTFDCVIPTREARHRAIWTPEGRINIRYERHINDKSLLQDGCECFACGKLGTTKAMLADCFHANNKEGGYRATLHNVYFFNNLMEQIRAFIKEDKFLEFKNQFLANFQSR